MTTNPLSEPGLSLLNRRNFLSHSINGLGGIGLLSLLAEEGLLANEPAPFLPQIIPEDPLRKRQPEYAAKAKQILVIFCTGACSHVDTWDYKPELIKMHGKQMPGTDELITFQSSPGALTKSPYAFRPRGESGKYTSDLFPRLGEWVDNISFIHSMTSPTNTHGPGETFMSTCETRDGSPSVGAWTSYALGSEANDLPAFVAIPDPRGVPQSGPNNWSSAFLPAVFQGTAFNAKRPIANLTRPEHISPQADQATRDFLKLLNEKHRQRNPGDSQLAARIASYELAAKLQLSAPQVSDLSRETTKTHKMYGTDSSDAVLAGYARNCLLARRLLERGVRFVQLFNGSFVSGGEGVSNWDGHKKLKEQYDVHGRRFDQPTAALLKDMQQRGMLEDTLILWVTEFGRMPFFQKGANGRDHNPKGFTTWLAGAGVKPATSYGATDEFGYMAVENATTVYDLYATMLHLLGLNHERLTFKNNGVERRLTNVHGHVIKDILL